MHDPWMRLGGCGALAAVESCIYFRLYCKKKRLCPIDVHHLTKESYRQFAMVMKPYLRPRFNGISRLSLYVDGMNEYLRDKKNDELKMELFPTGQSLTVAEKALTEQIDRKYLIPFLLLKPVSKEWKEYHWHWFLLAGYRWEEGRLFVKAITYGAAEWLSFEGLWDTADKDNGGMILYHFQEKKEEKNMSKVIEKVQGMISSPTCCAELKAAGQAYLDAVGTEKEAEAKEALLAEIEEDVMPIDGLIHFAGSEMGAKVFGERAADVLKHAEEVKANGGIYCDCPACADAVEVKELLK